MKVILIPTKALFEHASFHCPCLGEPDCCWLLQLSGHHWTTSRAFSSLLQVYFMQLQTMATYYFEFLKKNMPGSIKCCFFRYGLILKTSLISSGSHFRHNSSRLVLQFTIQSKRRKKKFERTSRDLWLKKYNDVTHTPIVFVKAPSSSVGFSLVTLLQLNGSIQRQQAELLLQLLAYPNITTYLMLHWD